ncbi:prolyl oligopeptidase family serine peptidase [Allosphingosinicella sp.]|jgi:prolyl oligopeptidase|uniref:prolyl oligopeptidase family serine peptidase n=1 Tax=Allosphingosinicella sp. TaxID=2823234 RepID=UPI002F03C87C
MAPSRVIPPDDFEGENNIVKLTLLAFIGTALLTATGADAQSLTNPPVRPPAVPFSETIFGDRVDDPYRWMESADRAADVSSFIRAASEHNVRQLAALPGRQRLRDRIDAATQAGVRYGDLQAARDLLFYRRTDPGAQLAKLVVRTRGGRERILYDPEAGAARQPAINSYSVAPNGRLVALHTAAGGGEVGTVRFIDVATGALLPDRLEPVWGEFQVGWLDDRTVVYTRMRAANAQESGGDALQNMRSFVRRLGGTDSAPLLGAGVEGSPPMQPQDFPFVAVQEGSDWAVGFVSGARADSRVLVARRSDVAAGRAAWRAIADYPDQVRGTALIGDRLFLLTTRDAPNGKVVAIDLAGTGTLQSAVTVVPEGHAILTGLADARGGLYVTGQSDGISRLFHLARGRGEPVEVRLPMEGLASGFGRVSRGSGLTFAMQDWFTAPRWFRADGTEVVPLGLDSASYAEVGGARQIRETARSADGTSVPMAILLPPGAEPGRPLPMLLDGYGSYGFPMIEPFYLQYYFGLLEEGGAVAFCGTRGGGERGRAWHEAGRSANKPNAHADLIACGERLVELGYTAPGRMTVMGTSAGGLLAPPAAIRRPDLFGGLIANVAILNPTRLAVAENGPNQFAEMGDPGTEEGYRALLSADSYRMLADAGDIPDTLLLVGLNDRRVSPWFSAKFAARALQRFGNRRLVLIRTDPEAGHGVGSAREQLVEMYADAFAFVLNQAGAEGFGER